MAKIVNAYLDIAAFEKYRVRQDQLYQSDFDRLLLEMEKEG